MASDPTKPEIPSLLQGKLLIASPALHDGVFDRTVILLVAHSTENGAVGLILNHPIEKHVGQVTDEASCLPLQNISVHHGGPVFENKMTFASFWWHRKHGLHWATQLSAEEASTHIKQPGRLVRAFVGYSGWSPGQLEKEIKENTWMTASPKNTLLGLTHDRTLWADVLRGLSPVHRIIAEAPENPYLN